MKDKIRNLVNCPHIEIIPQSVIGNSNDDNNDVNYSNESNSSFSIRKSLVI